MKPYVKVQVKEGKTWKDLDETLYDITFINNVNKGNATILVNAAGSKTAGSKTAGSKTTSFKIGTRSFGLFSWL